MRNNNKYLKKGINTKSLYSIDAFCKCNWKRRLMKVFFEGTVKDSLDSFNLFAEQKIWKALEEVQLKSEVEMIHKHELNLASARDN